MVVQGVDKKSHSERESLTALEPQEVSMAQIIDHYSTDYQPQATQFGQHQLVSRPLFSSR